MSSDWLVALTVLNSVILAGMGLAILFLYRQWGGLVLLGSEGLNKHHGVALGSVAPEVVGGSVSDGGTLSYQPRREVIAFGNPACPICEEKGYLFRDLSVVQDEWRVTYVHAGGDASELPPQVADFASDGRLRVLLDEERRTSDAFEVRVSPFVVVVDETGRVASKGLLGGLEGLVDLLIEAGDESLKELRDALSEGRLVIDPDPSSGRLLARSVVPLRESVA